MTSLYLEYKSDMAKEETRILCDEIGLINLEKLERLALHMNRRAKLTELCDYF